MTATKLTIGMAVVNDRKGVYTTIQHMRMTNNLQYCEFIVVDNKPDSPQSSDTKKYLEEKVNNQGGVLARYIPLASPTGTTPPRNKVFSEAKGEAVLCMDSHVLTETGSIDRLIKWYEEHPTSLDLYSGPIVYDNLQDSETHFDDVWRSAMWGTWGRAWICSCHTNNTYDSTNGPLRFTVKPYPDGNSLYLSLTPKPVAVTFCNRCGRQIPESPHGSHRKDLQGQGYILLGSSPDEEPFEIPGQGLGLFTCRKEAWLGFNEHFRQFGGEEMYIHEKYRQAGRKCINLPFLRWNHDFWRAPGSNYQITNYGKIRNYVIGHNELNLPLDRVYNHFVKGIGMSKAEQERLLITEKDWQYLISDPISNEVSPRSQGGCATNPNCGKKQKGAESGLPQPPIPIGKSLSLKELLTWAKGIPRDLDQHLDKLTELAEQCQHVTEISKRRESTVALAQCPGMVKSYNVELDPLHERLAEAHPKLTIERKQSTLLNKIEPTELLFIDSQHTANRLYEELSKFAPYVTRWIVLHDTQIYGEKGEDGGPGLLPALRRYMAEQPKWSVIHHTQTQYGLTVIGCRPEDKSKLPGYLTMASNFTKALAEHVADGMKKVELPVMEARLETCMTCPQRVNDQCSVCGCYVAEKAKWRTAMCPLNYWKE